MNTPIENAESMQIGRVDFVSPDEIKVLLDLDAPEDIALNSGIPRPFPRVNSYVLVASESGYLVGQIEWITIEQSPFPKRKGLQDFGVIDLPFPQRKMGVVPIGVLHVSCCSEDDNEAYEFSRGIEIFPTVADPVLIPTQAQLKAIVESGSNRRVKIGTCPMAGNSIVSVDPDRIFGRHLAILGNTGSGKSCSVAGLIRWSIEAAKKEDGSNPNTRFVILDPNGEYAKSFSDIGNVRVYGAEEKPELGMKQLEVPLWLWNADEWTAIAQASGKAQRPTLIQALRCAREESVNVEDKNRYRMRKYLESMRNSHQKEINEAIPWNGGGKAKGYREKLEAWKSDIEDCKCFSDDKNDALYNLYLAIEDVLTSNNQEWPVYSAKEVYALQDKIYATYEIFCGDLADSSPIDENIPVPFSESDLISSIELNAEILGTTEYVETMLARIKTLLSDATLSPVINSNSHPTLESWLDEYICPSNKSDGSITVIDLSLLPAEITHIIVSVMARITLEALQRYRRDNNGEVLPLVLVMEEAHTFIKKYNSDDSESATAMCSRVFEKIAREGRKYGLGLVLSSQRPSELSSTVLSQCNSFLLHRITNDRDQELVGRLVPDNLRGLLRELPSLPSRNAILLGWASELPVMVNMNYLEEEHRPKSDDPQYWYAWVDNEKKLDWGEVSRSWTKGEA